MVNAALLRRVKTLALEVAFEEHGAENARVVILLHGYPYDPRAFDVVAAELASDGHRVIVPYLRGHGETRFLDARHPRSGEQAALGSDLVELMDALNVRGAVLAGYDWGGRAACITAAVRPDLVAGLVTANGYNILGRTARYHQFDAAWMHRLWYAYCLQSDAGANAFRNDPASFNRYLWSLWSPDWQFDQAVFERSAISFANPDYAEVVIHSYRHRAGLAAGDPSVADLAARLVEQPPIEVPTIVLHGASDTVQPPSAAWADSGLRNVRDHRLLPRVGHNIPQEAPQAVIEAVRALID